MVEMDVSPAGEAELAAAPAGEAELATAPAGEAELAAAPAGDEEAELAADADEDPDTDGAKKKKKLTPEEIAALEREGDAALSGLLGTQLRPLSDFLFCVISKGREANVSHMERMLKAGGAEHICWFVGAGEVAAYEAAGASRAVEGGKLCASRNAAIDAARAAHKICVQCSDDLQGVQCLAAESAAEIFGTERYHKPADQAAANQQGKRQWRVTLAAAARVLEALMRHGSRDARKAKLAGVYPNANSGMAMNADPVSTDLFCVGDFLVIEPDCALRFDERMTLKEDYDFTAQHLAKHGAVARSNRVWVTALHYKNEGGAVADRNDEKEQFNIALLKYKWPGAIAKHPTRGENEVFFAWSRRTVELGGSTKHKRPPPPPGVKEEPLRPPKDQKTLMSFFGRPKPPAP